MGDQPHAGGMNLLDLKGRSRRPQGFYWACLVLSIGVHGGFLAYVLAYARQPAQRTQRPAAIDVELIGTSQFAALRGDRENAGAEARSENVPPLARLDREALPLQEDVQVRARLEQGTAEHDTADSGAKALAAQIEAPLPEDGARMGKPPVPQRMLKPELGGDPTAISAPMAEPGPRVTLPARRKLAREARLRERSMAGSLPEEDLTTPAAMPLPPLELIATSGKADAVPGSEESRAPALDMGAQGSPVVAVLPKEAGIAMFAARIIQDAQMLPEDRPVARPMTSERPTESPPVPLPARRVTRHAPSSGPKAEYVDPESNEDQSESAAAGARKARAYRGSVRARLAANRPGGAYGSGRAVVAFNLTPGGSVRSVRIVRSSGHAALDQSVLQSVYRAEPFPKPPRGLKPAQLRFVVPFEFR